MHDSIQPDSIVWKSKDGDVIACTEKLKVLRDNLREIQEICQDAFEDALLMGCDETQLRAVLRQVVDDLKNPYRT
jgi:hypothetical protein